MPAKIIPFPSFMQGHRSLAVEFHPIRVSGPPCGWDKAEGIHLVATGAPETQAVYTEVCRESQQKAFRIVQEVQQEWNDRHHATQGERSPQFWATLPVPQQERETPFTVVRRLMHMLLSHPKTA